MRCVQGKAGMELLVRIAARLYAKKGINCNAVIPGLVLAGAALCLYAPKCAHMLPDDDNNRQSLEMQQLPSSVPSCACTNAPLLKRACPLQEEPLMPWRRMRH